MKSIFLVSLVAFLAGFQSNAADSPRYAARVVCFDGALDSGSSCSATAFPRDDASQATNAMSCGLPGKVSDLEWEFVGRRGDKDIYQFKRRFPADAQNSSTTIKNAEFSDARVIVFQDAFQTIVIEPPTTNSPATNAPAKKFVMHFTEPDPLDFNEHEGYQPIFDGVSLKGWDGNPKFWRVEEGAIIGESTRENPSGNSYLVYRDMKAKDFTLKFEMKIIGKGGSGFQYRSQTGIPWLAPISPVVTSNVGPVNLNWMMTGPQADFWPSQIYTGQFYSENTPMRIISWRGQVVESFGDQKKRLMGTIGDRADLGKFVKMDDWNEYTVIARGGTCMHIVNGQLMAVIVDDDPNSSNNQPGLFGIEIEAITKLFVRNIWVKKLD